MDRSRGSALLRSAAAYGLLLAVALPGCRPKEGLPQHYDDPQAMIAAFETDERDAWALPDRVVRSLAIDDKDGVVADIGAGSGYFTRRLAAEVPEGRVYAVDVDGEFEDYLLENREAWGTPNIEPHLALYDDPMLPASGLDLVFTANTYAFIRDRVDYFTKVRSSLRAGGHVAIIDFRPDATPPGSIAPAPEHRVSRDTALTELAEAGFVLEREETFLPHQWFLILQPKS
ncbi:MAG: methyltransferase domain-containing protein [Myxococcales bacterium]|nr:methyltransferase domain-containing protein [Myxococcales bacterium]